MKLVVSAVDYAYPITTEPSWSSKVARWYQLDAPAFGLAHIYFSLAGEKCPKPDFLIMASTGGSSETDFQFASSGANSPAKFVHTLPSVRALPLMQVMEYEGPLLCFQNDPTTWLTGIREAVDLIGVGRDLVWIFGVTRRAPGSYRAIWAQVGQNELGPVAQNAQTFLINRAYGREHNIDHKVEYIVDQDFWSWWDQRQVADEFPLSMELSLKRYYEKAV